MTTLNLSPPKRMAMRKALQAKGVRFSGLTDQELSDAFSKYCENLSVEANEKVEETVIIEEVEEPKTQTPRRGRPQAPGLDVAAITQALEAFNAQADTKHEVKELFAQVNAEMVKAECAFANIRTLFTQYI